MLRDASFLIAPSRWAADTFTRYFPDQAVEVIAHGAPGVWALHETGHDGAARAARLAVVLPDDDMPTVAVLGAVGPDKGARRHRAHGGAGVRAKNARLRFVLIGYLDRQNTAWQSDDAVFTVHGRYDPRDLPDLFRHYRVRLVAYPSAGPETFSFTLSESWAAGRAVVVPPFGALAERVEGTGAGWIWTQEEWEDERRCSRASSTVLAPGNVGALDAASQQARACPQPTLTTMAQRTLALYERTLTVHRDGRALAQAKPLDARRVRDALGYTVWTPPPSLAPVEVLPPPAGEAVAAPASQPREDVLTHVSRLALRWRHTLPGRVLYRVTPNRILDALKDRLS